MLGDISPQTVRITQQVVAYPGRDHVCILTVKRFDGRTYKPVDMTAVTRVILSFPEANPVIVYDSSVQAVFTPVGTTLTVDLSDYAMPASVLGCQIILYDAEHPAGQVLVDDIDAVVQFDFRNVSVTGGTPPPAVEYITDAPTDGVIYARKDGLWVPVDALVSGVSSVNGQSGVVVLDAADVGADTAGTAATASAAAVAAHTALADPHPQYLTPAEGNAAYDASGAATSAVSTHVADSDPHPQYTTQSEGDARYERGLTAGANITIDRTNPVAPVISASGGGGGGAVDSVNGQTGVVVLDAADVGADAAGTAEAAVAAHVAATNPHPEYLTQAEGDTAYAPIAHVGAGGAAHANAVAAGAAGFMTGADKTKLDGVATGATANDTNTELRGRSTHTGTQAASTISDLAAAVRATVLTGLSLASGAAIAATDSALIALGKLQKQITDLAAAVSGKQAALVSGTNIKTINGASLLGAGDIALEKYRGLYVSLAALNTALPTASAGDYADVDSGSGSNVKRYIWDTSDTAWVEQTGGVSGMANPMTTAGDLIVGGSAGVPNRLGLGSSAQVLRVNLAGTGLEYATPAAGGGLTNLTEAKKSASPNATVPVVQLAVSVSEANGDASVTPKGTGAFTLHVPDGAIAGGAKRGIYSVDLSLARTSSAHVASGNYSAVFGGESLRASASYSASLGGKGNTASGISSATLAGDTCAASGQYAVTIGGQSNTASGTHSACLGGSSLTVSGTYAVGSGLGCIANGVSSYAQGAYSSARQVHGSFAFSAGRFGTTGDAQTMSLQLRQQTSNATPVRLTSNATAAAAANQMVLPSSAAFWYSGQVVAMDTAGNTAVWSMEGLIKSNSGGTVSLVGTPSVSLIAQDAAASSWAVAVAVDSTNRCLAVNVTGAASTTIRWLCNLETVQLVF